MKVPQSPPRSPTAALSSEPSDTVQPPRAGESSSRRRSRDSMIAMHLAPRPIRREFDTRAADTEGDTDNHAGQRSVRARTGEAAAHSQSPLVVLPPDLHLEIGSRLDAQSRDGLAAAHPAIGRGLHTLMRSDAFVGQASHVESSAQFQQLFDAIATHPSPIQRVKPLISLVQRLHALPLIDRSNAFRAVLGVVDSLDPRQGELLVALANNVHALPGESRRDAVTVLLDVHAQLPPEERTAIQCAVGSQIRFLQPEFQQAGLDAVLAAAALLPPQMRGPVLASLAPYAGNGTDAAAHAYWRLSSIVGAMEPEHRGVALAALAAEIGSLPQNAHAQAFQETLRMTFEMPPATRAAPLAELAQQIPHVIQQGRAAAFAQLRQAILALPPASRATAAGRLAHRVDWLDMDGRTAEFDRLLDVAERIPLEQQPDVLSALAMRVGTLGTGSHAALAQLLAALEWLPQSSRTAPLGALRAHVASWRAPESRRAALAAVGEAIARLDAEHRPPEPFPQPPRTRVHRW